MLLYLNKDYLFHGCIIGPLMWYIENKLNYIIVIHSYSYIHHVLVNNFIITDNVVLFLISTRTLTPCVSY